ncbi:uncharacterized protein Z518_10568 [Rhinocladiella mackenziei CBS 650.93]|uniref:Uncharacterized protein n=1 Tax=Rhinocladiella mackenziei CBS 650.93 TaxID=1442369 RepID=A0A0D2I3R6_9EURO|nr:uncharacterized protein Z518_10568 [Rhinocladiella mackenziei CBS 650.93]KIX00429.1 hypothetical protein Z518_10568 [Rhinocladiella mackenziei CBS 650.93]
MTRRKRTSSPSPSGAQKRVAFEIPASLHQLSTISRSLATNTNSHAPSGSTSPVANTQSQPRLTSRSSSSHSASSFSTTSPTVQHTPAKFVPQKHSFPGSQPWPQPVPKPQALLAVSKQIEEITGKKPTPTNVSPPSAAAQARPPLPTPLTSKVLPKGRPSPPRSQNEEPVLNPGETPVLSTHPNLIASLIAKKRAENEAKGNRARWARRQAEYRMAKSPATQPMNELNTEVDRNKIKQPQPRSVSNPLPARSVPNAPAANAPTPNVSEDQTPAAESVSTPPTVDSAKGIETAKDSRPNDSDSLFGSTFSSPIAEFLERATDNANLREALGPHSIMSTQSSSQNLVGHPTSALADATSKSQDVAIPPLFSGKSMANQASDQVQQLSPVTNANFALNSPSVMQQKLPRNSSTSGQTQGSHAAAMAQHPLPQSQQFYDGVPGYQKLDWRGFPGDTTSSVAMRPNFTLGSNYGPPTRSTNMPYYAMGMTGPYAMEARTPPGPIQTYGNTVLTAAAGDNEPARSQQSNPGLMTAVDMVAGINTKFKIATKSNFSVPKR